MSCDTKTPCARCRISGAVCTYKRLDGVSLGATSSVGSSHNDNESNANGQRVGISIDFLLNFTSPSGYRPSAAIAAEAAELDDQDGMTHVQPDTHDQDMAHDQSFFEFADIPSVFFGFPFLVSGREYDYESLIKNDSLTPELEDAYALEVRVREMLQQLSAKHSSMLERNDAVDATFDYQLAEAVFTVGNVRHFVWAFFRYFHYSFPILHNSTFDIQTVSFPLLLTLVLFGSMTTLESDASIGVRRFSHIAEAYIFDQLVSRQMLQADQSVLVNDEHLQLLQAGLLFLVFLNNSNDIVTRRRIRLQRIPSLVAAVRASGLFAHKQNHIVPGQHEYDWQGFINDEMRLRYCKPAHIVCLKSLTTLADWVCGPASSTPPSPYFSTIPHKLPSVRRQVVCPARRLCSELRPPPTSRALHRFSFRDHERIHYPSSCQVCFFVLFQGMRMNGKSAFHHLTC